MTSLHRATFLALALSSASVIASASPATGVRASSSWSDLRFEVTDLRPDDGIAAGYQMTPSNERQDRTDVSAVLVKGDRSGTIWWDERESTIPFDPMSISVTQGGRTGAAAIDANGNGSSSAAISERGEASSIARVVRYSSERWEPRDGGMLLAPYTMLTVSVLATLYAEDVGILDGTESTAYAHGVMSSTLPDWGNSSTTVSDGVELSTTKDSFAEALSTDKYLTMLLVNDTAEVQLRRFHLEVVSFVTAVPEPSTLALALAGGLAIWGARARNRKR